MKTYIIAATIALLLVGCAHNQPSTGLAKPVQVPELPAELGKKATRLPDITDPTFGGIIKDGTLADQQYNSVSHQLNKVIDLYNCVRVAINDDKDPKAACLTSK